MPDSSGVMIVTETTAGALAPIAAELAGIGRQLADSLGEPLVAALLGHGVERMAAELGTIGVDGGFVADAPALADGNPDAILAALLAIVREATPRVILFGHTPGLREVAVRLAFRIRTGLTTDCTGLRVEDGTVVMTKPVFGGSALAEFSVDGQPQIATIRPRAFEPAPRQEGRQVETRQVQFELGEAVGVRVVETVREVATSGPSLKDAKAVVSGGRGIGGPENWHYVDELASTLGAAVGATRAVTDAGWVPPTHQVGLTGTTITPDLYITVGVSGAVQHIAGCSGSRNIVAINKDPDANIFKHARFGIIGDYKQVVPALTRRIKALRS